MSIRTRALGQCRHAPYLAAVLAIVFSITPAMTTLHGTIATGLPHAKLYAPLAVAVTVGVHLAFGRRTILSVGIGTAVYVVLANAF